MDAGSETGDNHEVVLPDAETPVVDGADEDTEHGAEADIHTEHEREPAEDETREPAEDETREPAEDEAGAASVLTPDGPLEPQEIDAENAAFVLLGVVLVVGLIVAAIVL